MAEFTCRRQGSATCQKAVRSASSVDSVASDSQLVQVKLLAFRFFFVQRLYFSLLFERAAELRGVVHDLLERQREH